MTEPNIARLLFVLAAAAALVAVIAELSEWEHLFAWMAAAIGLTAAGHALR